MLVLAAVLLGLVSLPRLEVTLLPESRSSTLLVWVPFDGAAVPEVEEAVARPVEETSLGVPGVRSVRTRVVSGGASFPRRPAPGRRSGPGRSLPARAAGWRALELPPRRRTPARAGWSGRGSPGDGAGARGRGHRRGGRLGGERPAGAPGAGGRRRPGRDPGRPAPRDPGDAARGEDALPRHRRGGDRAGAARRERRSAGRDRPPARRALRAGDGDAAAQRRGRGGRRPATGRGSAAARARCRGRDGGVRGSGGGSSASTTGTRSGILVHRRSGANQLRLADGVREQLERLAGEFPELSLAVVADSSPFVRQAVDGVWQAMWLGGLLAFGVLFLFLRDARSPLFLIAALPVSAVVTFAALERLGTSLNLMSLGGIALGMGHARRQRDRLPGERASASRARSPRGRRGRARRAGDRASDPRVHADHLRRLRAAGVRARDGRRPCSAIRPSPSACRCWRAGWRRSHSCRCWWRRFPGPVDGAVRRPWFGLYHRALEAGLRRPGRLLGFTAAGVAAALALLSVAPRELLPEVATDHLEISVETPPGTDVTATDDGARRVEAWLRARDEVSSVVHDGRRTSARWTPPIRRAVRTARRCAPVSRTRIRPGARNSSRRSPATSTPIRR